MLKKIITILGIVAAVVAVSTITAFTIPHNNLFSQRNDWIQKVEKDKDLANKLGYTSDTKYYYNRITLAFADDLYHQDIKYMQGLQKEYDQYKDFVTVQFQNETDFDCDLVIINKKELLEKTGIDILDLPIIPDTPSGSSNSVVEYGDYLFLINKTSLTDNGTVWEGFFTNQADEYAGAFTDQFLHKSFKERVEIMDSCVQCYNLALESDLRTALDGTKEIYKHSITTPIYDNKSEVIINKSTTESSNTETTSSN